MTFVVEFFETRLMILIDETEIAFYPDSVTDMYLSTVMDEVIQTWVGKVGKERGLWPLSTVGVKTRVLGSSLTNAMSATPQDPTFMHLGDPALI